jgi:hypothetical protein
LQLVLTARIFEGIQLRRRGGQLSYSWSTLPSATGYDIVRGSIGALPVGPGGGDEICFPDLASPTLTDSTLPAAGGGYWYLSRGKNSCGTGPYGLRRDGNPRVTTTCP